MTVTNTGESHVVSLSFGDPIITGMAKYGVGIEMQEQRRTITNFIM